MVGHAVLDGQTDDDQHPAGRQQLAGSADPGLQLEVVQARDEDDPVERRGGSVVEEAGLDHLDRGEIGETRPRGRRGGRIRFQADEVTDGRCEPLQQQPVAAADVEHPSASPENPQDPRVIGRVVVPVGSRARHRDPVCR
jgi:hypothetical protein